MDAPPPTPLIPQKSEYENIYYNCTECSSLIEILSINEEKNIIEFKCRNNNNDHEKKIMTINKYLDAMRFNIKKKVNEDKCEKHYKKYKCYCFDCNFHLCKECLRSRTHLNNLKNNIIELITFKE